MKTTIAEIVTKVDCMQNIIVRIEDGEDLEDYHDYIRTMLQEYIDILLDKKVEI